jgi:hypothetical protein
MLWAAVQPLARVLRRRGWLDIAWHWGLMTRSAVGSQFGSPGWSSAVLTLPRIAGQKGDQSL